MGLSVVLDVVYNHTFASGPTSRYSVLDKVVPGYYHRRSEGGRVLDSTCCNNTACEHRMMGRLVVDDLLHWALHYGIDGFRFDIMGHLMKSTVLEAQRRLARLTVAQDGVDGGRIYLYGEGWNFGEMVGNARGVNAWQDNLRGSGIGSFNDRIRDKGLGGSPFSDARCQGFLTGLATMPRTEPDLDQGTPEQQWENLAHQTDVLKLCMLGSLSSLSVPQCGGGSIHASEFRYPDGSLVAFAQEPDEVRELGGLRPGARRSGSLLDTTTTAPPRPLQSVNYVACHDNRTLWDQCVFKAPLGTSRETVVRMCMLSHALVVLSQGIPFIGAGDELLRSKSLDRDSYNSGDWFNRVDWTGTSNGFGAMGLPPASKNRDYWPLVSSTLSSLATLDCWVDSNQTGLGLS